MQFEIYSEGARRVIFFARHEASNVGARKIYPAHLVLGLLRESKAMFFRLKTTPAKLLLIQQACSKARAGRKPVSTSVDKPLDEDSIHILERAQEEMQDRRHREIDVEHLLLAALHVPSKTKNILDRQGLDYQQVAAILFRHRDEGYAGDALDYT